jgi:hypothetical protein
MFKPAFIGLIFFLFSSLGLSRVTFDRGPIDEKVRSLIDASNDVSNNNAYLSREYARMQQRDASVDIQLRETQRRTGDFCQQTVNIVDTLANAVVSNCSIPEMVSTMSSVEFEAGAKNEAAGEFLRNIERMTYRLGVDSGQPYRTPELERDRNELQREVALLTSSLKALNEQRIQAFQVVRDNLLGQRCHESYNEILYSHVSTLIIQNCSAEVIRGEVDSYVNFMINSQSSPVTTLNEIQSKYVTIRETERRLVEVISTAQHLIASMNEVLDASRATRGLASTVERSPRPRRKPQHGETHLGSRAQ